MAVNAIPSGYHTVTPYLIVEDVAGLIAFVERGFDAREICRIAGPEGSIMHAEVRIGDSVVMMADATDAYPTAPAVLHLYVEDADAVYERAMQAGATSMREPTDEFYGNRMAGVRDAWGNQWWIATQVEEVSPDELERRMRSMATA